MPPLSVMIKPSSGNCNMHCDYCFYCDEMNNRTQSLYGYMSEETLKQVIRKTLLRAEGSISYAFQGGEPTLRGLPFFEKVVELQQKYNKNHVVIHNAFQTNGYALNEDWCRFFHDHQFLVGVSVDGTGPIHDSMRHVRANGAGSFDRIMENIRLLEKYHVEYNILTVVTAKVARNIRDIYRFYSKMNWNYQQYIECLDPLGRERGQEPYSLTPELYGTFLTELFELWYDDLKKGKTPYNRKFENYVAIMAGYTPESCEQRGICGMQMVVEADGSVYPCDFYMLDEHCLGNFNEHRLDDIDQKRKEIGFIGESLKISQVCKACRYYQVCRGGCQRSKIFYPEENGYRSYFCKGYQMFFDAKYTDLLEIADRVKRQK